ncbi:MAG: hypothetical protein ACK5NK_09420 [Niabella sp.]
MKILVLLTLFILSFAGCKEDNDSTQKIEKEKLIGKWVNTQLEIDTLFWDNTIVLRNDTLTSLPKHSYNYELIEDSLSLEYDGEYYILAPKSNFKLSMNKDKSVITIEGIEGYFPKYKGNQFKRIITTD